jgi:hypothetical protein
MFKNNDIDSIKSYTTSILKQMYLVSLPVFYNDNFFK